MTKNEQETYKENELKFERVKKLVITKNQTEGKLKINFEGIKRNWET